MALTKPIEQPSSITTEYHRIKQVISLAWDGETPRVELWGETYATEQARKDGKAPVDGGMRYDCDLDPVEAAVIKAILYQAVKRAYMSDATDHVAKEDVDVAEVIAATEALIQIPKETE